MCPRCRPSLARPPDRALGAGVVATGAWSHRGAARSLVHRCKYDGISVVAALAAAWLDPPEGVSALVPVPRVLARRIAHGVDPSRALAEALAARWGVPVVDALGVAWWAPRRAGRRLRPAPPSFRARAVVPGAAIVDDVVTTGATAVAAATAVGAHRVVAMTLVSKSPPRHAAVRTMAAPPA